MLYYTRICIYIHVYTVYMYVHVRMHILFMYNACNYACIYLMYMYMYIYTYVSCILWHVFNHVCTCIRMYANALYIIIQTCNVDVWPIWQVCYVSVYRIAGYFRGVYISRISKLLRFAELIFAKLVQKPTPMYLA